MRGFFLAVAVVLGGMAAAKAGEANLLKNGALTCAEGKVENWSLRQGADTLEAEAADKPEGCAGSLRVTTKEADNKLAELAQKIAAPQAQELTLTGWVRSEAPGAAILQVKLYKGREELKRINSAVSKESWEKITLTFPTEGADRIEILCRWWRKDRFVGKKAWFAGLSLQPVAKTGQAGPTDQSGAVATGADANRENAAAVTANEVPEETAAQQPEAANKKPLAVIALAGDSTVQNYPAESDRRGWGQILPDFF